MAYDDLLKSVEESALEKERDLRKKAQAAIDDIRARSKIQADEIRQTHLDVIKRSVTSERNKQFYLMKAENKELLIRTRERAFERAFHDAEARLDNLRSDPMYPEIFSRLVSEAARGFTGGLFVIHIDPRDETLCRGTLAALGMSPEIRSDITTAGGVVAALPDNSVVISNTVESRLQRARELKRKEIHAILSGA